MFEYLSGLHVVEIMHFFDLTPVFSDENFGESQFSNFARSSKILQIFFLDSPSLCPRHGYFVGTIF